MALLAMLPRIRSRGLFIWLGLFGAALLYGDGIITPAISVLSATEGLEIAAPGFAPYVLRRSWCCFCSFGFSVMGPRGAAARAVAWCEYLQGHARRTRFHHVFEHGIEELTRPSGLRQLDSFFRRERPSPCGQRPGSSVEPSRSVRRPKDSTGRNRITR
jgi:hypothetical protein